MARSKRTNRTVQQEVERQRKQAVSVASMARKAAMKTDEKAHAVRLNRIADALEKTARSSMIGRTGTKEERQARAEQANMTLNEALKNVNDIKRMTTKQGFKEAKSLREQQEKSFKQHVEMSKLNDSEYFGNRAFFEATRSLWKGAKTPDERLRLITEGLDAADIFEAREKYEMKLGNKKFSDIADEIDLAKSGNWAKLKDLGYSDDEINELKEMLAEGDKGDTPIDLAIMSRYGL